MDRRSVAIVVGTRPEAIKLAPLVQRLSRSGAFAPLIISTGQHRQMLDQALGTFGLRPDIDLGIMSPKQTLHDITTRALDRLRHVLQERRPAWVVVQGDTTTAFAAALAGFYGKLPVAHVEAGLRSGERYAPFPEEINRRMIDQLSDVLFAPTEPARQLLLREGFDPDRVFNTGNTVVDALLATRELVRRSPPEIPGFSPERLAGRRMILVTAHRRESFGDALKGICRALLRVARDVPDACIVYPVHMNPNVAGPVRNMLGHHERIALLEPVSYVQFVSLMDRAHLVMTDSGGVQEEAPTFAKPLLVMRDVTERPEGIEAGVARLVGTAEERIYEETMALLTQPERYRAMASGINPYGDGAAAWRIAELLETMSGLDAAPREKRRGRTASSPAAQPWNLL
ncbi:non-hydrolyzing UDP-N-acetylglucosamine 2-epimerase [Sorangium sp. So ce385]|uniref:non-hydrolyzing UDP-N-acetylglucosamine 2-epimerase n=1 Tax=Sorangium sp. So ce385 TaxID=3133308 RepID=UPI003F5B010A